MTLEELVDAGFPTENWPADLPQPGEETIATAEAGTQKLFRYQVEIGGKAYAMEVVVDTATLSNAAEGVGFMLNQFAYLWRTNKDGVAVQPDGSCRRVNF